MNGPLLDRGPSPIISGVVTPFKMLSEITWSYPRPITTVAVQSVAVTTTLAARAMLPRSWRPSGALPIIVASAGAYVALRVGSHTGRSKQFKHAVLDGLGGDVDDAQTWILGALGGGGVLVALRLLRRSPEARRGRQSVQ
ncbi:MAG: hypothetical protein QOJ66_46 [Ilumatobacteraceae bacterium]